jgi:hypothetical protein
MEFSKYNEAPVSIAEQIMSKSAADS